jgi:hypothetical protein
LVSVDPGGGTEFVLRPHREGVAVAAQADGTAECVIQTADSGYTEPSVFRIASLDIGLLDRGIAASVEQIHRTGVSCRVIALVSVDPGGGTGFAWRPHRQGIAVAAQADGTAEEVPRIGIAGLDIGLLGPGVAAALEHIHRTA